MLAATVAYADFYVIPVKGHDTCNGVACEPIQDENGIFVSEQTGSDTESCGTKVDTCFSISQGISRAQSEGKTTVYVADGIYRENIVLANGISLKGGYNHLTWVRHLENTLTIIEGVEEVNVHSKTVRAEEIDALTIFEGFVVFGRRNNAPGGNSYALYVKDATDKLTIEHNRIYAGKGGDAVLGAMGWNGSDGADGGNGAEGHTASGTNFVPGGSGGNGFCYGVPVSGGNGGSLQAPFPYDESNPAGSNGTGPQGGAGGYSGSNGEYNTINNTCRLPSETMNGVEGMSGSDGMDGMNGNSCQDAEGSVVNFEWIGMAGQDGTNGGNGSSGGGGGSGSGVDISGSEFRYGSTGGGGGAGGCGGSGGSGGQAGGGAFGLFVVYSSSVSDFPHIENNVIYLGNGGKGADGVYGGRGGERGKGGKSGTTSLFCTGSGADGGDGGDGGNGGNGGGGCGGVSYGLYYHGSVTAPNWDDFNTFVSQGSGGSGGVGAVDGTYANTNL